ncbi:MAG TPA: GNAT family N-acetyltransferase [Firmicutes bacterium]|nr:GNAT family N-acetyltransferase [Bacillota bacterium]
MERFYLEKPSLSRKNQILEYIEEMKKHESQIHGDGRLKKYLDEKSYEEWVINVHNMGNEKYALSKGLVPSSTYFLIRENDDKLIGMIDLRIKLNDYLRNYGGNIGYSIRPTERKKGYAKIQLYLCLLKCKEYDLDKVLITCANYNEGSRRTILSLGGIYEKNNINKLEEEILELYWINVDESIKKYKDEYSKYII